MDQVEAKRHKEHYEQNIKGASMIHLKDMPQHLVDGGLISFVTSAVRFTTSKPI
jgi:hypothetical protein